MNMAKKTGVYQKGIFIIVIKGPLPDFLIFFVYNNEIGREGLRLVVVQTSSQHS